jgi:serine phosphatase RsbU (regulator of sigma subunit)
MEEHHQVLAPATFTQQEQRQRHLERLLAVDPSTDDRFRRITRLATTIFGVSTATVTLVDGQATSLQAPADREFFIRTVESGTALLVQDATADDDFARLGAVTGPPYLRFYAGIPLIDDDGVVLGAFCLYDTVPRRLDRTQWATLVELASWARQDLVDSEDMARARLVQESLLPRSAPVLAGYELSAFCLPTKSVGGDFYDFGVSPGRLNVSLVDVMGKGAGAALVAATVRALLRASLSEVAVGLGARQPGNVDRPIRGGISGVVADVDRLVNADLARTGTLVTGFFCEIVTATGLIRYIDAGHGLAVLLRSGGAADWLRTADLPLGVEPIGSWTDHEATLQPGDTLLCVSDGLLDLLGGTGEALDGMANLSRSHSCPGALIDQIRQLTERGIPVDDVTAIAIRREGAHI